MNPWRSTDAEAFTALVWFGTALDEGGLDPPSLRAIARGRCSAGTLLNWFGSKGELHRRVLRTLGVKWGHTLTSTLVPLTDQDRFYARMRLAFDELARNDAVLAAAVDELAELERDVITWWLDSTHPGVAINPRVLTVLHALLLRLWDERVHPDPQASLALWEAVINVWIGEPAIEHAYTRQRS
jgi:hypothetical protein